MFVRMVWLTDCKSVYDALRRPVMAKMADKRLGIELACLRQSLWRRRGEAIGDSRMCDEMPADSTDIVRWIDTDVMVADPLTKAMDPEKLIYVMTHGYYDIKQPIESLAKKRQKQAQRRKDAGDATEDRVSDE